MNHGPLGIHLSIGGGYDKAVAYAKELGIGCCQVFTHNPRGWQFATLDEEKVTTFVQQLQALGVDPITSHCNYLINLGTSDPEMRQKSIACLKKEFVYADAFGCAYFILHVGKHKEAGIEQGIANVAAGINAIKKTILAHDVMLLLETVAGQGSEIGVTFEELAKIWEQLDAELHDRVGVCVDTCHIFAAGYDIRSPQAVNAVVQAMDKAFGIERVKMVHLNDSLKELGSRRDRHTHIGKGFIGTAGFAAFLNHPKIAPLPKVLETPEDEERGYPENLAAIRKLQQ